MDLLNMSNRSHIHEFYKNLSNKTNIQSESDNVDLIFAMMEM